MVEQMYLEALEETDPDDTYKRLQQEASGLLAELRLVIPDVALDKLVKYASAKTELSYQDGLIGFRNGYRAGIKGL